MHRNIRALSLVLLLLVSAAACGPPNYKAGTPNTTGTLGTPTSHPTDDGWTPPATGGTLNPPRTTATPTETVETEQPTGHDYGPCENHEDWKGYSYKVIVGTEGDDVLKGSPANEEICGMGGNDTIVGGGGDDQIWGGPGDDVIHAGPGHDHLEGNDGNDILYGGNTNLRGEYDSLYGDTFDLYNKFDDAGDDVLVGGSLSPGELMYGGPGNDILQPTPVRTYANFLDGGDGKDVLIALNFSQVADHVDLDGKPNHSIAAPLTKNCKVKKQLSYDPGDNQPTGSLDCDLPWPPRLSGLKQILPVSASVDTNGHVSLDMTLYQGLGKLSVESWGNMVAWQASLVDDACICDPVTQIPDDPRLPYDYPS